MCDLLRMFKGVWPTAVPADLGTKNRVIKLPERSPSEKQENKQREVRRSCRMLKIVERLPRGSFRGMYRYRRQHGFDIHGQSFIFKPQKEFQRSVKGLVIDISTGF
jgi:hypothetical protein